MYTLENLKQKTFKELKEIGWQLSVLPDGDRRCRKNWIDALVGAKLPLLQLLEVSTAAEVEVVEEAIAEPIEVQRQEPIESSPTGFECPSCGAVYGLYIGKDCLDKSVIKCSHCNYSRTALECPNCGAVHGLFATQDYLDPTFRRSLNTIEGYKF